MKDLKVWPHLTIVAVLCAVLAGGGVALWMRHRQTSDQAYLSAARIQRVDGEVALNNSAANDAQGQWVNATINQPFTAGDRIYTRNNSHASIAFTGRNFARLYPNTSLDVLSLADRRTQLALRDGSAMFDVGYLSPGDLFEVATPYGAVDFDQPGLYNVGIDNGNVIVSVLSGLAQVVGLGGSGQIGKGEVLTLLGQTAADVVLSRIDGRNAGYLVNDYYGYQYPNYYDGRYADYNTYLNDPYYFDPYRRNVSYQYANSYLPGLNDLDYYGDWQNVSGYGYGWHPRVDTGWAPYEQGYWMNDYPYGPTWISSEPWGYAPYHYGRWANVNNQWFWIPDTSSQPIYSPALVAFIPVNQNEIGWVPLGPGDVYAPRYYNSNWQPTYLVRPDNAARFVNFDVPNAVTIVPVDDFIRGDDFRGGRRADRRTLQNVQAVLDPLTLTPLRNAVVHSAWGRGKIDLPPGIAKKLEETRVVTTAEPVGPPFRRDLARSMKVERVSDRAKNQKFKVKDERGLAQPQPVASRRDVNGDVKPGRSASSEDLRSKSQTERGAPSAQQQAQGERVSGSGHQQVRREEVRPQPPRASERPSVIRQQGPPVRVMPQRSNQPRSQPQERPVAPVRPQPTRSVEHSAAPRSVAPARPAKQGGPPQANQPRANEERKGGPPSAASPNGQGGGKGKGRKP